MKPFALLFAVLAALLVPTTSAVAGAAQADGGSNSKIPEELCFAVLGSDVERTLCSD